ncbi:MAG: hypothetical protein ABIA04_10750 [Pseudomonadota bacterium]
MLKKGEFNLNSNDWKEKISILMEGNLTNLFQDYSQVDGFTFESNENYGILISPYNSYLLNTVLYFNIVDESKLEFYISNIINTFSDKHLSFTWRIGGLSRNKDVIKLLLEKNGLKYLEDQPLMWLDFLDYFKSMSLSNPSKLNIKQIVDGEDYCDYLEVLSNGFQLDPIITSFFMKFQNFFGFKKSSKIRNFVGYYYDKPVCCSSIYTDNKSCSICNVTTKKEYRKRGFGREITLHSIREVHELGFPGVGLFSSFDGYELYRKLGFLKISSNIIYRM